MNIAKEFMIQQYISYMDKISKEEDFWKSYIVEDYEGLVCWIVLDKLNSFEDNKRYFNLRSESDSEYSPIDIIIFGADEIRPLNDELQYCDEVYASNIKENGMVYKYRKDSGRKIIKVDNSKPKESDLLKDFRKRLENRELVFDTNINNTIMENLRILKESEIDFDTMRKELR